MNSVLVIDDDQSFREMVCEMAKRLGYTTQQMTGGRQVLDGACVKSFDVVLTDIFMPEGEGMETIRKLRRDRPDMKIIAMSGSEAHNSGSSWLSMAEAMGADASLPKPFTKEALSAALAAKQQNWTSAS